MNRSRAAEANKHTLDVCQELVSRGGLVKHVVHRGNSFLYVCLPALFELYFQRHSVFIPSFTSYARTLSSELVLHDRTHTQRFPPHHPKAAAVTFRWPADRQDLPDAEELAEMLHLNEQPPQEAVSGIESGKISWGRNRIQARPRAQQQQQAQQQANSGIPAGSSTVGAAGADGPASFDAWLAVEGDAAAAPAGAEQEAPDARVPCSSAATDKGEQQDQRVGGRPGSTSTSSSSSSPLEGNHNSSSN
ncbi:hypothetical protein COO60DRAFT_205524 [Scenedesmus sp. NREL 46B-D3]|nr:hypothetical protein COO60DRAFT_205524 [Scenedesmus sp. NREL 46B-D3]